MMWHVMTDHVAAAGCVEPRYRVPYRLAVRA